MWLFYFICLKIFLIQESRFGKTILCIKLINLQVGLHNSMQNEKVWFKTQEAGGHFYRPTTLSFNILDQQCWFTVWFLSFTVITVPLSTNCLAGPSGRGWFWVYLCFSIKTANMRIILELCSKSNPNGIMSLYHVRRTIAMV